MDREPDPQTNDYDNVKNQFLKHLKMSAEQFRHKFILHSKESFASWHRFAFEKFL